MQRNLRLAQDGDVAAAAVARRAGRGAGLQPCLCHREASCERSLPAPALALSVASVGAVADATGAAGAAAGAVTAGLGEGGAGPVAAAMTPLRDAAAVTGGVVSTRATVAAGLRWLRR